MAQRLDEIIRGLDPTTNRFINSARIDYLRRALAQVKIHKQKMVLTSNLADELLKAGRTQEAIETANFLLSPPPDLVADAPPAAEARAFLALCYLRLGEQQNCINHNSIDACLLPIRGSGIYTAQAGPRAAIKEYAKLLKDDPGDLTSRWLLNIAYMTIGEYPAKVPPAWLIPPRTFDSEYDIKRFVNVAGRLGLSVSAHAGGGIMEDFDNDGFLDLMASSMGVHDQLRFFHNNGDGTFAERTDEAGLTGETGGLNIIQADYNNDGYTDVFVLRGGWMQKGGEFPKSLLKNNGDGTFEDVTEEAGLMNYSPTQVGAFGDYDGDGWLDLFVAGESQPDAPHPCALYHNNRDGTFTNVAADLGNPDLGYVKGAVWGDYDNDGRPDLFVSVLGGDNALYHNEGRRDPRGPGGEDWRFTNLARRAGVTAPKDSFPTWFFDYDNDGWLDLLVAGYRITSPGDIAAMYLGKEYKTEVPRLYHNNHDGTFTDVSRATKVDRVALPMGSNFGDLDNDGYPDCYFGNGEPSLRALMPNIMLRNDRGRVFQDVTTSGGFGHLQKGHAVAFGDIDNDGDQDIFEVMGGWFEGDVSHNALYLNPGHAGNHYVTLRVEGRRSNRSAIGTRIKITVNGADGPRDIYTTVGTGGSFGGNSLQQEIGLGRATRIVTLEATWPATGQVQVFRDVTIDRIYRLVEGEPSLTPVEAKTIKL